MASKQPIFPGTNRLDYKKIYGTADKLIKGQNYNINIIDHIIKQCAASGLSKNQTAVLLSHALAESDFNPLKRNSLGFLGLWLFSKDLWNKFFSKDSSYQNQVRYLMTETAKTKDPSKYKGWIQVQDGGNGWVGKHKKTWDLSNNLEAINKAFSFGWERFGDSHVGENNFRYSIAQMFRDYIDTKNFGFNDYDDNQNPNEYYMADNIWKEPENTLTMSDNTSKSYYSPYKDLTLKIYLAGGTLTRDNILMVGDSWGVGMKKYFPNNVAVSSSGLFSRKGHPELPSVEEQINKTNYSNGLIIVHSGGNDIAMRAASGGKEAVRNDVKRAIDAALAKGNKIIFVAAPWMNHSKTSITGNRDKYNEWLKEAALSLGAGFIDTNPIIDVMKRHLPNYGQFHLNNYSDYANYIYNEALKMMPTMNYSATTLNVEKDTNTNSQKASWIFEKPKKKTNDYINTNAMALVNFLTSKGLTLIAALGIAGNIKAESRFNPYSYNPSDGTGKSRGPSGGIALWHDVIGRGGNLTRLKLFALLRGKEWTDISLLAEFLWHDITEGVGKRMNLLLKLNDAKTIEDASFIFGDKYEVFKGHLYRNGEGHKTRRGYAKAFEKLYASGDYQFPEGTSLGLMASSNNEDPGISDEEPTAYNSDYTDYTDYTNYYNGNQSYNLIEDSDRGFSSRSFYNDVPILDLDNTRKYSVRDSGKSKSYVNYYDVVSNFVLNNPLRLLEGGTLYENLFELKSKTWPKPTALDYKDIINRVWTSSNAIDSILNDNNGISNKDISVPKIDLNDDLFKVTLDVDKKPDTSYNTYTVQEGEDLVDIADKFGIDFKDIISANDLTNPVVTKDLTLKIPYKIEEKQPDTDLFKKIDLDKLKLGGDSLSDIDTFYGTNLNSLEDFSNLSVKDKRLISILLDHQLTLEEMDRTLDENTLNFLSKFKEKNPDHIITYLDIVDSSKRPYKELSDFYDEIWKYLLANGFSLLNARLVLESIPTNESIVSDYIDKETNLDQQEKSKLMRQVYLSVEDFNNEFNSAS